MKCSKCGEECKAGQAFCLKCGTPIQIVPEFNLIEAELANSVGELMKEISEENTDDFMRPNKSAYRQEDTVYKDDFDIKLMNIEKPAKTNPDKKEQTVAKNTNANTSKETKKSKKNNRNKKLALGLGIVAFVLLICVVLFFTLKGSIGKPNTYDDYYRKAVQYLDKEEKENAADEFLKAEKLARTNEEKIKVKVGLMKAYTGIKNKTTQLIDVLVDLIDYYPDEPDYYKALVEIYDENDMETDLSEILEKIKNKPFADEFAEYLCSAPVPDIESGDYDHFFEVVLTADKDAKIYYTLDGTEPDKRSSLYDKPISIDMEGTVNLNAIAYGKDNMVSKVSKFEYNIQLKDMAAPNVIPDSGTYTSATKIEITAASNSKIYYTLDDSVPTTASLEYTEPIDMPRGKNIFRVIAVSNTGVISNVVTKIYDLKIPANYTYDQALVKLKESLVTDGTLVSSTGDMPNGSTMQFSYISTELIEGSEYYIINGNHMNSAGEKVKSYLYGVENISGDVINVVESDGLYTINR